MALTNKIIEEVGGTGSEVMRGTAPNTEDNGNNWEAVSDSNSWYRNNSQVEGDANDTIYVDTNNDNHRVVFTFNDGGSATGSNGVYVVVRGSSSDKTSNNGYVLQVRPQHGSNKFRLARRTSGTNTFVVNAPTNPSFTGGTDITVDVEIDGDDITASMTQGGTSISITYDITSASPTYSSGEYVGIDVVSYPSGMYIDDIIVYDDGSTPAATFIPRFLGVI